MKKIFDLFVIFFCLAIRNLVSKSGRVTICCFFMMMMTDRVPHV